MAGNIKSKTVEEIRDMSGFGNDFSSEEESDHAKKKELRKAQTNFATHHLRKPATRSSKEIWDNRSRSSSKEIWEN